MKRSPARPRFSKLSSFTLVELLVVMAIIIILASVILYAGGAALKSAKRAKAANMAIQIQTACLGYYTEYSVYPVGSATADGTSPASIADTSSGATAWGNLLSSLCGNIQPYNGTTWTPTSTSPTNSRGIAFLTFRSTDVDANNAPLNPLPTSTEIYFFIAMDADYDGVLGSGNSTAVLPNFSSSSTTSLAVTGGSSTAGVAVWANCTGITAPSSGTMTCNPNFWVHTY